MIQQIFKIANRSYEIVWYKWESLISDTISDKTINADKRQDITDNKKLNAAADKIINVNKR